MELEDMIRRLFITLCALLGVCTLAHAQFADQATYAGTGAGIASAQTLTLSNVSTLNDLLGVIIKYVPNVNNTGATTLTVNSLTPTAIRKPSGSGLIPLAGGANPELVIGQPAWLMYDGTFFDLLSATNDALTTTSATLANSALSFDSAVNLQLNGTVATNALTIAVKGNNGSDPSATNPVLIPFRSTTIGTGSPVIASLQSALSFTVNSGSTMGCTNALACRLWILAINSGTDGSPVVTLCAMNASVATQVYAINEGVMQTSQSGTGGGSTAGLIYCGVSAVTSKPIRILGYMELTETTAGTWATNPTFIQLMGSGIKKPGDIMQGPIVGTRSPATSSTSASFVTTNISASITPTSAVNLVMGQYSADCTPTAGTAQTMTYQPTRGATQISTAQTVSQGSSSIVYNCNGIFFDAPQTTSSTAYAPFFKVNAGQTADFPTTFGIIMLWEIMGRIDRPANDNYEQQRMFG
jgi:hypothetical protein